MAVLNSDIMNKVWLEGSNAFQQRVPNPSIAGMDAAVAAIFDPMNNDLYNEFSGLLNMIGNTYVYSRRFENPLRELKKPAQEFGATAREVAVKYMRAHAFDWTDETLLKTEAPEYVEWFYSVNYQTRFEFSWQRVQLRQAFASDGYGFNELLSATLDAQISSDNLNEMLTMVQQFATADDHWGLFRVNLSAAPTDKATSQELLSKVRATAGRMRFPSTMYNAIDVPSFESSETLVFWCTPEVDAVVDVFALADLFNIDRADIKYRKIVIPEFPIPNVYAALTSEDFIYMRDYEYGVYQFWNPSKLEDKYYLHHWAMVGANPAAFCALFTTDAATTVPTTSFTMSAISLAFSDTSGTTVTTIDAMRRPYVKARVTLTGTASNNVFNLPIEPDAATYEITATRSSASIPIGKTFIDSAGFIHLDKRAFEDNDVISITATSAYLNPSAATGSRFTDTETLTIANSAENRQKGGIVSDEPNIDYIGDSDTAGA